MKYKYILKIDQDGDRWLYEFDENLVCTMKRPESCYQSILQGDEIRDSYDPLIGKGNFGLKPGEIAVIEVDRKPVKQVVIAKKKVSTIIEKARELMSTGAEFFSWEGVDIYWVDKYDCCIEQLEAA